MRISIVDDHTLILNGLKTMLKSEKTITDISTYQTAKALLDGLENVHPEVLLLDVELPDISGIDLCAILIHDYPLINILALSNYNDSSIVKTMIKMGAKGYVLKNCSKQELLKGILAASRGQLYFSDAIQQKLFEESLGQARSPSFIPKITQRELEVLGAISNELSNKEIAEQLFISVKTVEAHRKNLFQKFGVKNTAGLIKQAFQKGLL